MSAEQMVADMQTKSSNQRRAIEQELQSIRATLRVIIEGQAQMYADICRIQSDAPIDADAYKALMNEWKQDTAKLIEKILEGEVEDHTSL